MGMAEERQKEKQLGCMAGFFQIFDRHQIHVLSTKRLYSAKPLPPPPPPTTGLLESATESTRTPTPTSPSPNPTPDVIPSPEPEPEPPSTPSKSSPLPFPVFETPPPRSHSPWKFSKEAPRLSLDSRATTDAKGFLYPREIRTQQQHPQQQTPQPDDDSDKQRRSPSVVARLMGLDQLPHHHHSDPNAPQFQNAQLRRSASESRVNKDIFRFVEPATAFAKHESLKQHHMNTQSNNCPGCDNNANDEANVKIRPNVDSYSRKAEKATPTTSSPVKINQRGGSGLGLVQRKSFYDTTDFFPEPKQSVTIYDEIERRLRMRGIDEPSKDLETLKQILEALQLKGLLHSSKPGPQICQRNFVRDRDRFDESPIVVMRTAPMNNRNSVSSRSGSVNYSSPSSYSMRPRAAARRGPSVNGDPISKRENAVRSQNRAKSSVSPTRCESSVKSPSRRRLVNVEAQQRRIASDVSERRVSPVQSPRFGSRRLEPAMSRSPRTRRMENHNHQEEDGEEEEEKVFLAAEDQRSVLSESSISSVSQMDTERSKVEVYKVGRNLLERCDKLLHSIAEITSSTPDLQPSPVSVLDSSFYKEELSPSPIMKRTIVFNDQPAESDDDTWSSAVSPISMKLEENSDDGDFNYISDVLRASSYLPEDSDVFMLLEKQQYLKGKDTSKVSRLKRKLIFDITTEILDRKQNLPKWKNASLTNTTFERPSLQQIWTEFQKIRERNASEDLFEVICGVLRKDLAGDALYGWKDCPVEISEAVLYIERLLFKDLITETIQDLAAFSGNCNKVQLPRRKLVF